MPLQNIINDPDKRKKIVMYINPPYAEAGNTKQKSGTGTNKSKTSIENKTYLKYKDKIGKASNEISAQFLIRIFFEITDSIIANFSKLKSLQSSNFNEFRKIFDPKLERLFLVQANTFDNVKGQFPIGFFIWNSKTKESFNQIFADVFNKNGDIICQKNICNYDNLKGRINTWLSSRSKNLAPPIIGQIHSNSNDFQHQNDVFIDNESGKKTFGGLHVSISYTNLIEASILYAVRHCVEATWLNDRDQFLYPDNKWKEDQEFQGNCITYTLFSNNIQSKYGPNHWIPFTEYEVGSREKFESDFMIQFIQGKGNPTMVQEALFDYPSHPKQNAPLEFSPEAQAVFNAGRQLWKYYHKQPDCNVNASLYDIREYFQGRNEQGKMNNKSEDETYSNLISDLRESLKILAKKIEPKVYEYGFLKQ